MTNRLSLAWFPPDAHLARKMVAKRLVITAVGRSTYSHIFQLWPQSAQKGKCGRDRGVRIVGVRHARRIC
jgi:hypothetical protein